MELVAEEDGQVVGHILFSRLQVVAGRTSFPAVALAPLAVEPSFHGTGIGGALVREAHLRLKAAGEKLSVVVGDPAYYGRFGYSRERAQKFESAVSVRGAAGAGLAGSARDRPAGLPGRLQRRARGLTSGRRAHAALSPGCRI